MQEKSSGLLDEPKIHLGSGPQQAQKPTILKQQPSGKSTKRPVRWGETSKETTIMCSLIPTKNTKPTKKIKNPKCAVVIVQKKQNKNKCILQVST